MSYTKEDLQKAREPDVSSYEFLQVMEQMGYSITTHGTSGAPLKHPKLTPPDAGKNYRFDTLGEDYTLERILDRIYSNTHRAPAFSQSKPILGIVVQKHTYKMTRKPAHKLTGLRALYFKYCVLLGTVKNHPERLQRPSYLLREDVLKLDQYIATAKLLIDNKIETVADLRAYRKGLQKHIAQLITERRELRNKHNRQNCSELVPAKLDCESQIKHVCTSLRRTRIEMKLCNEIEEGSYRISENLHHKMESIMIAVNDYYENNQQR